MTKSLRVLCVFCAVAFGIAGMASAQDAPTPIEEVRANSRTHIGPLYMTPSIVLREFGIDNNVFNEGADPKSDFTFTLNPKADVAVPISHRALLQASAGADLVYFQKYSSERSLNPRFAPRAEVFLHKLSVFAEGSYLRSRQRPNFEIDARSLRTERSAGGGIAYRYSPKLSFVLGASRADVKYEAGENVVLRETLNRNSLVVNGSARYSVTALTTIVLRADTSQDRFEFSPMRNADTIRVMPGVEFNARALITGSAYVGVRTFRTKSDLLEDFKGLVGSAALGYTLFGRTMFVGTADRDLTYSFEELQPYYLVNSYGLTVRHRLTGKFDVTAGAARHQYTYRDLLVVEAGVPTFTAPDAGPRVDVTRNYSASFGYTLGDALRVGFGVSYWRRDSSSWRDRDYHALRTGVSLTYGF